MTNVVTPKHLFFLIFLFVFVSVLLPSHVTQAKTIKEREDELHQEKVLAAEKVAKQLADAKAARQTRDKAEKTVSDIKTLLVQKIKVIEPEMIAIKGGCFLMGSPDSEKNRDSDEKQHQVCVKDFALGKTEVTFTEYDVFANVTGQALPKDEGWGRDKRPVINVSWYDAIAYITWLNKKTGKSYRLPTESEWEYAARAKTETPFYTGECLSTTEANYDGNHPYNNCLKTDIYKQQTVTVGSYQPNPWTLSDMAGNVWEWTCSEYDKDYSGKEKKCADNNSPSRVLRGGSWGNIGGFSRSANRSRYTSILRYKTFGFRLAL